MKNYWIDRAESIHEREVLLLKASAQANRWYSQMGVRIPTWFEEIDSKGNLLSPRHQIGWTHSIRLTTLGIEGVIRAARKYHRFPHILSRNIGGLSTEDEFWVVLEKERT